MLIGAGLQWAIGPIYWSLMAQPVNIILLSVYIASLIIAYFFRTKVYAIRWAMQHSAAIPSIAACAIATIVHGLTNLHETLSLWPFVMLYFWMTTILGLASINRIVRMFKDKGRKDLSFYTNHVSFLLNHLGLFIAITSATLGNADIHRATLQLEEGQQELQAIEEDTHRVITLPMCIRLDRFTLETYPNGEAKRFASDVTISRQGEVKSHTIEVNKPLQIEGWKIYQYSYEIWADDAPKISVFELVRDPWLPVVYIGIYMMIAGAFIMFATKRRRHTSVSDEK